MFLSDVYVRSFSLSLLYVNKILYYKKLSVVQPHLWPQIKILFSGGHESWCSTRLTAAAFHFFALFIWHAALYLLCECRCSFISDVEALCAGLFGRRLSQVEEVAVSDSPGKTTGADSCAALTPLRPAKDLPLCPSWLGTPVSHLPKAAW